MKKNKDNREEKMKETKKVDVISIILIVILILLICFLVGYKIKNWGILSNRNKTVKELYSYFSTEDLGECEGLFNYSTEKVNYDNVSATAKLCIAYKKADAEKFKKISYEGDGTCKEGDMVFKTDTDEGTICTVNKIKQNVLDDSYKKLFGKEIENNEEFKYDGTHICYLKDGYYYCGLSENMKITLTNEITVFRSIARAEKKDDTITIYDYFTKVTNNNCYFNYTTLNLNQMCTTNLPKDIDTIDYDFVEKYGVKYKHVYKKAKDGSYYWVSSEPVEYPGTKAKDE